MSDTQGMFPASIFESLQQKIDEDTAVRDSLREIVQTLEKQDRVTQAILSRAHSSAPSELPDVVKAAEASIQKEVETVQKLAEAASKYPYYKYNGMWTRQVQDVSSSILFCGYLGGLSSPPGALLPLSTVGTILSIPTNLSKADSFHLTLEEYLQSLLTLVDELSRLARNSVTSGDYARPVEIAKFVKDVHAGFQILNLKNDSLRKRSDGVKYRVKEVEDVVYDLSLRGLVAKEG